MLTAIRNFAKSWPARILMAVLAVSFVGWGVNRGAVSAVAGDDVIKAGSRTIDSAEFRREYDSYKKRIEQQSGQTITPELAAANNLDAKVLQGVATREALAELIRRSGIQPADKLLLAQIEKIPAFFDPISGRFDRTTFQRRLGENGMTPKMFDQVLRDEMAAQHWAVGVQNGLMVPRAYGALASIFSQEARDLAFFTVTPQSVPQPALPTDAQLATFIKENTAQLTLPEMRVLTLVGFSPQGVAAAVSGPVDPAALKKRYDFRKDTFSKPETRTLVQIPAKNAAAADQIAAGLRRGEAPAAIAKSLGVDAITYDEKPLTAIADRKVAQAAFGLAPGQVAPVQGDLGMAVVKVLGVTPGRVVTLEEARPMLEAEIRKEMVAEKVYAQTQAYDDAHQGGSSLPDAARKAGAPVMTIGPISQQGVDAQGRQLQGLSPKIIEQGFSLPAGGDSELTDLGEGASFAVRVEKIVPPHVPPLEEIRPIITRVWMQREIVRQLEARAAALSERVKKGEPLAAVAASGGYAVTSIPALSRQTASSHQEVPREVLGRAFGATPGEVWMIQAPTGMVVGRIDNVRADTGPTAARLADASRPELTGALFHEITEAAQVYARTRLKVRVDPAKARAAVGFEPIAPKGKAEKKK